MDGTNIMVADDTTLQSQQSTNKKPFQPQPIIDNNTKGYVNPIAYLLAIFEGVFEEATNKLQYGEAQLTASMENVIKNINDNKNTTLSKDNSAINAAIKQYNTDVAKKANEDVLTGDQMAVQSAENKYKYDDSDFQSTLQIMTPTAQADTDEVTSISQNNAQIFQIAMYIIGILQLLPQLLKS